MDPYVLILLDDGFVECATQSKTKLLKAMSQVKPESWFDAAGKCHVEKNVTLEVWSEDGRLKRVKGEDDINSYCNRLSNPD